MAEKKSKIDRSVVDSPEWAAVLDHLEQMQPRYLADLLRNGGLRDVIESRLVAYAQMLNRLQEGNPGEPIQNLLEMANDILVPVNPNWQDETPLTAEDEQLLKAFRSSSLRYSLATSAQRTRLHRNSQLRCVAPTRAGPRTEWVFRMRAERQLARLRRVLGTLMAEMSFLMMVSDVSWPLTLPRQVPGNQDFANGPT